MAVLSDVLGLLRAAPATAQRTLWRALERTDDESAAGLRQRTLVYGAGWAGVILARSAQQDPEAGFVPVGFLDDDRSLKGSRAADLPILGDVNDLTAARRRTGASSVLLALPYASGTRIRRVVDAALADGLSVRTVPAATELLDGAIETRHVRPLRAEDLLRGPVTAPTDALQELVEDETVMVSGAGGRFGSQLARRLLALKPRRIVMVDQAEQRLDAAAHELRRAPRVVDGATQISKHVLDVTDRSAIAELLQQADPAVIVHAATIAGTAARERSAAEAVRVNVGGTKSLIGAAIDHRVERFVLVSPDSSLDRSGDIDTSLRLAEMVVSDAARRTGRAFSSVRVGRLAETSQGAIEAMRAQLESGQPIWVDASRPSPRPMPIAEASGLILEAAAAAGPGSIHRLDRGMPLRAGDAARDLLRLLGRDVDRIPITIVGRPSGATSPGRRDETVPTKVPGLLRVATVPATPVTFEADVDRFLALATSGEVDRLRVELTRYVRFLYSTDTPYFDENGLRPVVPVPVASGTRISSPRSIAGRRAPRRADGADRDARSAATPRTRSASDDALTVIDRGSPRVTRR